MGWTIVFIDYDNKLDLALSQYKQMAGIGWNKKDNDKIMEIFLEIEKHHYIENARMVIEEY